MESMESGAKSLTLGALTFRVLERRDRRVQRTPESNTERRGQPGGWGVQEGPEQSAWEGRTGRTKVPNLLGRGGRGREVVCIN